MCALGIDLSSLQPKLCALGQVTLATKPILHGSSKFIEGDSGPNFHQTIPHWQCVVEDARIGEITHAEAVQPLYGTRAALAFFFIVDADLAGEHSVQDLTTKHTGVHTGVLTPRFHAQFIDVPGKLSRMHVETESGGPLEFVFNLAPKKAGPAPRAWA